MQIDFHHTAIYVLCRLAGMKSLYAEKVAYASQQVDNANFDHALKFKNGGVFHQIRTSHEDLAFLKMVDVNDAFDVWLPFHFVPSGEGAIFPVGHAVAAKNPDIPFAVWSYLRDNEEIKVNNLKDRFIPAVIEIFKYLVDYLEVNNQYGRPITSSLSEGNMKKIIRLLKLNGSYQERHQNCLEMIQCNGFGFLDFDDVDKNLDYAKRTWFNQAVLAIKAKGIVDRIEYASYNYHKFERKNIFNKADWTLFMRAAAIHKYKLLHEILPTCGLYIG